MKRIIASPRLCTLLDISVHRSPDSDILMPKGSATVPAMYRRYFGLCMHAHESVYAFEHRVYVLDHSAHRLVIEDGPPCASAKLDRFLEGSAGSLGRRVRSGSSLIGRSVECEDVRFGRRALERSGKLETRIGVSLLHVFVRILHTRVTYLYRDDISPL